MMQHLRFRALLLSLMHLSLLCVHSARAEDALIVEAIPAVEVVSAPVVEAVVAEVAPVTEIVVEVAPITPVAEVVAPEAAPVQVVESVVAPVIEAAPVAVVEAAAVIEAVITAVVEAVPAAEVAPIVEAVVAALVEAAPVVTETAPAVDAIVSPVVVETPAPAAEPAPVVEVAPVIEAVVASIVEAITTPEPAVEEAAVDPVVEEPAPAPAPIERSKSAWAMWCHANGDNSLAEFIDYNTNNMASAKINDNILVLVQADRPNDNGTFRYRVTKNNVELLAHLSYEMGQEPGQEIVDGLSWARSLYDFDNLILNLWGHGSGIQDPNFRHRGILFDDTNASYLNNQEMSWVMDQVAEQLGKKVDIFGTDACLMGALEVGWQIKNSVARLVASETTIPGLGWDYAPFLSAIAKNGLISGDDVAKAIVKAYGDFYARSTESYTLSAMDLNKIQAVVTSLHKVIDGLNKCMSQDKKKVMVALTSARSMSLEMDDNSYIDLWTFLSALSTQLNRIRFRGMDELDLDDVAEGQEDSGDAEDSEEERGIVDNIVSYFIDSEETRAFKNDINTLKTTLKGAMKAIDAAILATRAGNGMNKAHGMTIYFPPARQSIHASYPLTKFAQETRWLNDFLKGIMGYK